MKQEKYTVNTVRCLYKDGYLWYVTIVGAMIMRTSVSTWETEVVALIPKKYRKDDDFTYDCGAFLGNRLILFPGFEDFLLDYDLITGEFTGIPIVCPELEGNSRNGNSLKFRDAYVVENRLFLLPYSCHKIIEYDPEEKSFIEHFAWYDDLFSEFGWSDITLFRCSKMIDGSFWLLCNEINALMEFKIDSRKAILHYIGSEDCRFSAFTICKKDLLAIWDYAHKQIIIWNKKNCKIQETVDLSVEMSGESLNTTFSTIERIGNRLVFVPYDGSDYIIVDYEFNGKLSVEAKKKSSGMYISMTNFDAGNYLFVTQIGNDNMLYDVIKNEWENIHFELDAAKFPIDFYSFSPVSEDANRSSLLEFVNYITRM